MGRGTTSSPRRSSSMESCTLGRGYKPRPLTGDQAASTASIQQRWVMSASSWKPAQRWANRTRIQQLYGTPRETFQTTPHESRLGPRRNVISSDPEVTISAGPSQVLLPTKGYAGG